MNTNAATIIDLARMAILNTVLLDNIDRGAANPWASPGRRTARLSSSPTPAPMKSA